MMISIFRSKALQRSVSIPEVALRSLTSDSKYLHPHLSILYEDNHVLVVDKPAGLLSQEDKGGEQDQLRIARTYLEKAGKKEGRAYIGLVHRLDRNVSGCMMFAKTSKAAARLNEEIKKRRVFKTYLAMVCGELRGGGRLDLHLLPMSDNKMRVITPLSYKKSSSSSAVGGEEEEKNIGKRKMMGAGDKPAQYASLEYQSLGVYKHERAGAQTLVEVQLITGKKHQIRVSLAHLRHPICGDIKYGAPTPFKDRSIALHAHSLEFKHPTKKADEGKPVILKISAPLPEVWTKRFGSHIIERAEERRRWRRKDQ